jgi:hypothetical protein
MSYSKHLVDELNRDLDPEPFRYGEETEPEREPDAESSE